MLFSWKKFLSVPFFPRHQPRSHFQLSTDDGIVDDDKSTNDDSCEDTDEIPIWVRGEQRWISGITDDTTCGQLVEALLRDDGVDVEQIDVLDQYVITERWRRVEQVLNSSTKVQKIWIAWGATQSEVNILKLFSFDLLVLWIYFWRYIQRVFQNSNYWSSVNTLVLRLHRYVYQNNF